MQRHEFADAATKFQAVLERPSANDLHERARVYLNLCRRQAERAPAAPISSEERVYAATLAANAGRLDEALSHLRALGNEAAEHDHVQYLLAVIHAQRGAVREGLAYLERAIALNHDNRALARQDPDLDALRADPGFAQVLATAAANRRAPRERG
jgi:tetratricopeptide (TPR) repeat protein